MVIASQVAGRLARPPNLAELVALDVAAMVCLDVVGAGGEGTRRGLLATNVVAAFSTRGVLQLLASLQEAMIDASGMSETWFDDVTHGWQQRVTAIATLSTTVVADDEALLAGLAELDGGGSGGGSGEAFGGA